jgi:hypothetical protein
MAQTEITTDSLHQLLSNMDDAEFVEARAALVNKISLYYIRTLIDQERLNEVIVEPLVRDPDRAAIQCLSTSKVITITRLEEALEQLLSGAVVLNDKADDSWLAVPLENSLGRSVESSDVETIIYGARDSFNEQIEQNITMIRRRLPLAELKTEKFVVGTLSKTTLIVMYLDGLTNPEFIEMTRIKISKIDFDQFLDSSQVAAFMEDHHHTIFPQYLETDRPDACANALAIGKLVILVNNTPYVLIAPITFFHLFQSPEDYFLRWPVASFFRCIRYFGFFLSVVLIPMYVALATHHYQMLPLQILYILMESRSKLPFSPFWEAFIMIITLEIIKEASLRMPTKTSQTLGIIGGIVIGQAAVQAGFASKILIVLMGISAISSFLIPNYLMTKSSTLIQFVFLVLSAFLGIPGIIMGIIVFLVHLNALSSLKQPYFAPVSPFYGKEWLDLFIRGPLIWLKTRPESLRPLQIWRQSKRR